MADKTLKIGNTTDTITTTAKGTITLNTNNVFKGGRIRNASYSSSGYTTDQYGNPRHNTTDTNQHFAVMNNNNVVTGQCNFETGAMKIAGTLTLENHSTPVGNYTSTSFSSKNIVAGIDNETTSGSTCALAASISLPAGSYIITGAASFPNSTDNANTYTGSNSIYMKTINSSGTLINGCENRIMQGNGAYQVLHASFLHSATYSCTVQLFVRSHAAKKGLAGNLNVVRIA